MVREDVFRAALENYRQAFPKLDAYHVLSSRLCMSEKTLRAKVAGERSFTLHEVEQLFLACFFPQGYELLKNFVFHPDPKVKR